MKKLYEESNIKAIANAIRSKNGKSDKYKTADMAAAIEAMEAGGGSGDCNRMHIPEEALVLKGEAIYRFAYKSWNWFLNTVERFIRFAEALRMTARSLKGKVSRSNRHPLL